MARSARRPMSRGPFHSARPLRLRVEGLEDRSVPAVFLVTNDLNAGAGSFRQAILDSDALAGADEVRFDPVFFAGPRTVTLTTGELRVRDDLTVTGPGAGLLTVTGNNASRVFNVYDGDTDTRRAVRIEGLTIAGGRHLTGGGIDNSEALHLVGCTVSGNSASQTGGGIYSDGTLALTSCTVSGNSAPGYFGDYGYGGGIWSNGDVTLTNCTLSGNTAAEHTGGIGVRGALTMTGSTVSENVGGGINAIGVATITDCTVSGNTGDDGGGIYSLGDLTVTNSTVSGNAADGNGGGIYCDGTLTVADSTVAGNTAYYDGGGIFSFGTLMVANSTVAENTTSTGTGGGVSALGGTVTVANSTVAENTAGQDGGGIIAVSSILTVTNCTVAGNTAASGGGISSLSSDLTAKGVTVSGNTASERVGGGIVALGGTATITNSTVSGNTAGGDGGGIYSRDGALTVTQSTVSGNAAAAGGNLALASGGATLAHSILADAVSGGDVSPAGAGVVLSGVNLVEDGSVAGPGVVHADPLLGPLADNGGPTKTHLLVAGSPAVDAGDSALLPPSAFDQRGPGYSRLRGAGLDLGAVETQPAGPVTVAVVAGLAREGDPAASALVFAVRRAGNPADPLDVPAAFGGTALPADYAVTVAGGTQTPAGFRFAAGSAELTVTLPAVDDDDAETAETVLLTVGPGPGVPADAGMGVIDRDFDTQVTTTADDGPGSLRLALRNAGDRPGADVVTFDPAVFSAPRTIVLTSGQLMIDSEVTITGPGPGLLTVSAGGASRVFGVFDDSFARRNVRIEGMTITGGRSIGPGGGIWNSEALELVDTVVTGNASDWNGGGIANLYGGRLTVANSTVSGNSAVRDGGGVFGRETAVTVADSVISGNTAGRDGGGVANDQGTVNLVNSTVSGNTAGGGGGGLSNRGYYDAYYGYAYPGEATLTQVTVTGNAALTGGNLANGEFGELTLANSLVADVVAGGDVFRSGEEGEELVLSGVNLVEDGSVAGPGVIHADPLLGPLTDYGGPTLTRAPLPGSPLIDAGDTGLVPIGVTTDQRGLDRVYGSAVDIGAVETQPPRVTINQGATQPDPTIVPSVVFEVDFTVPVTGFDAADIDLTQSTAGGDLAAAVAQVAPTKYAVTVTGMTTSGTVAAFIPAGAAADPAGHGSAASTSDDNQVVFAEDVPTVTINQAPGQEDPTGRPVIAFVVEFSEPVTGFSGADVSFAGSTVGGTLQAAVAATGPATYTVTVTGMTTRGAVAASVPAGVVTDSAGLPNEASTSTDNGVEFLNAGTLAFTSSSHTTAEGGALRVFVSRTGGSDGEVSINYATAAGMALAGSDFTTQTGTLTWAEADSADKFFDVPIVNDAANEGREQFQATLSGQAGGALVGLATTGIAIAPSDGQVIEATANVPQAVFTDDAGAAGDEVTVRLGGKVGTATIYLTDPDGDGRGPIEWVDLAGTDAAKSTLTITPRKPRGGTGDGLSTLAEVSGTGLKSLTAAKTDLIGTGIHLIGYLGSLKVGNVGGGADILVGGAPPAALRNPSVKVTAGVIGDGSDVTVAAAPLGSLTAIAVGDGTVAAPSVGTITAKGKARTKTAAAIPGDFNADVSVGGGLKKLKVAGGVADAVLTVAGHLSGLSVTGRVSGTTVDVAGNVGAVSVGSFWNSRLDAGYTGASNGGGTFDAASVVGPFRVTAKTEGFQNSYVIATTIKPVTLASITETNGGTKFGFIARETLAGLTVTSPTQKFKFDPTQPSPQGLPGWDFQATDLDGPAGP
jgi:hypothetical protein